VKEGIKFLSSSPQCICFFSISGKYFTPSCTPQGGANEFKIHILNPQSFSWKRKILSTVGCLDMGISTTDETIIASKLTGNTLRVYWHLLRSSTGVVGVRETQRSLGFSSPALALYHLDKLSELGLVQKVRNEYRLAKTINIGVLKQFAKIGTFLLPRYALYATMFTTLLVFYVSQFRAVNFYSVFGLIFGILATGILWYEGLRIWRQRP